MDSDSHKDQSLQMYHYIKLSVTRQIYYEPSEQRRIRGPPGFIVWIGPPGFIVWIGPPGFVIVKAYTP